MSASREDPAPGTALPLFGSWRNAYVTVVAIFVLDVVVFYAINRYFA